MSNPDNPAQIRTSGSPNTYMYISHIKYIKQQNFKLKIIILKKFFIYNFNLLNKLSIINLLKMFKLILIAILCIALTQAKGTEGISDTCKFLINNIKFI